MFLFAARQGKIELNCVKFSRNHLSLVRFEVCVGHLLGRSFI